MFNPFSHPLIKSSFSRSRSASLAPSLHAPAASRCCRLQHALAGPHTRWHRHPNASAPPLQRIAGEPDLASCHQLALPLNKHGIPLSNTDDTTTNAVFAEAVRLPSALLPASKRVVQQLRLLSSSEFRLPASPRRFWLPCQHHTDASALDTPAQSRMQTDTHRDADIHRDGDTQI